MSELRAIYIIWYRDVLLRWRDKVRIVGTLGQPLIFLIVFGVGLGGSMRALAPGVNFLTFMFPGIVAMSVLVTSLMSAMSIVWDREFGFLKEVLVAPVSRSSVVLGKTLGGATIAAFQGALMLVLAPFLGIDLSLLTVIELLPLMLLVAWALSGAGILIASKMKSMEGFQVVMQMLIMPIVFLSGIFFPVTNLPSWLNAIVKLNPATYGVDAIRQLMLGFGASGDLAAAPPATLAITIMGHSLSIVQDMMIVSAFGLLMMVLAMWSFSLQE